MISALPWKELNILHQVGNLTEAAFETRDYTPLESPSHIGSQFETPRQSPTLTAQLTPEQSPSPVRMPSPSPSESGQQEDIEYPAMLEEEEEEPTAPVQDLEEEVAPVVPPQCHCQCHNMQPPQPTTKDSSTQFHVADHDLVPGVEQISDDEIDYEDLESVHEETIRRMEIEQKAILIEKQKTELETAQLVRKQRKEEVKRVLEEKRYYQSRRAYYNGQIDCQCHWTFLSASVILHLPFNTFPLFPIRSNVRIGILFLWFT